MPNEAQEIGGEEAVGVRDKRPPPARPSHAGIFGDILEQAQLEWVVDTVVHVPWYHHKAENHV